MQIETSKLIEELLVKLSVVDKTILELKKLSETELNYKKTPETWSILECLEHLNLYGDYYLRAIEKAIDKNIIAPSAKYRSGWLGDYFVKLMEPQNGNIKKMKSPKDKDPNGSRLTHITLERFVKQQGKLRELLLRSAKIDLKKTKVAISIAPFIKLRLGDTFRFMVAHIERHVLQAVEIKN